MVTRYTPRYRTLEQLIDSVSIDLRAIYSDGVIEIAELIKIVQDCNYELGIQINQTKETILDAEHYRAKLPNDFQFLNFAMLCHHSTVVSQLYPPGLVKEESLLPVTYSPTLNLTSCPCWSVHTSVPTQTTYVDCKGDTHVLNLTSGTTKLCAKSVTIPPPVPLPCNQWQLTTLGGWWDYSVNYCDGTTGILRVFDGITQSVCAITMPVVVDHEKDPSSQTTALKAACGFTSGTTITATTSSFCYNDPNTATYTCDQPRDCVCVDSQPNCNAEPNPDPWMQNRVRAICNGTVGIKIEQACGTQVRCYEHTEPLFIQPCRRSSAFSCTDAFKVHGNIAFLRDNYLEIGRDCGKIYMNYQGLMEDKDGNLLVLDHPKINLYYEAALKTRIIENLYINGEGDMERRLQYMKGELKVAKHEAMNVAYMPDFQVILETFREERKNENEKHFLPFSRFFGQFAGTSFIDRYFNGRYRQ